MDLKGIAEAYQLVYEKKKLDPVGKEDEDINNDGKVNSSDEYLKKRRAAIGKAMGKDGGKEEDEEDKEDKNKKVKIRLRKNKKSVRFVIEDEGGGFDFNNLPDPTSPENLEKVKGRGIFLIKNLSDKAKFKNGGRVVDMLFKL